MSHMGGYRRPLLYFHRLSQSDLWRENFAS